MPVVGFINGGSADANGNYVAAFRKGLNETNYVEGENLTVEYHWLDGHYDRLQALMADLVHRQVAVIATPATRWLRSQPKLQQRRSRSSSVSSGTRCGSVWSASLAQPGGNATGINLFLQEVAAKRLRLLHDLVPKAVRIAVFVNPANTSTTEATLREVRDAAPILGLQIQVLNAATIGEIDAAFTALGRDRSDALFVAADPFFGSRCEQLHLDGRRADPGGLCRP